MAARAKSSVTGAMGRAIAHDSAELHVTGRARYIDDLAEPWGLVHVVPGFAPDAAAGRITGCDLEAVRTAPGVLAVLTHEDIPGINDCSPVKGDDPILAKDAIRFHAQVVFAVVAETREAARRAAPLARIVIAAETPAVTVDDALRLATEDVAPPYGFGRGDAAAAIARAPQRITERFLTGGQEHFYLEGQIAMAIPEEQGAMTVLSSTQHPTEVQHTVAKMLGVADALVTCECRRMGGGFGGKESQAAQWAALAALAAHVTGRPAKCRLDRDDDMIMTGKRHDFVTDYRVGFDATGRLAGVDIALYARAGCSADLSAAVCDRALFHADNAYHYPAVALRSRRLFTNTVSNTAFRGFGGPQGMLAAERIMEAIAARLGLDPLDVRKRNLYGRGRDLTPYGMKVVHNLLPDIIATLETTSDYRRRRAAIAAFNAGSPVLKKGLSLAPVKFGIAFTLTHLNQAGALVHVYTDGSVHLNHAGTEMGQGLYIKIAQVVADEFGLAPDRVRITATTTGKVPNTGPTAASSGTDLNGMAAKAAAATIKARMRTEAAKLWNTGEARIRFAGGAVSAGNRRMSFGELARHCHGQRVSLSATGFYATPKVHWDRPKAKGRPFLYFAYGAACSEVLVDTTTGEMRVTRADLLHDCGQSLNPAIDIGQVEGGFVQGMGWPTTEELVYDDRGRLRTHAPSTYKIPAVGDVPEDFRTDLYEAKGGNPEATIYRSKAVGEPPLMLGISVWTAIYDAVAAIAPGRLPTLDAPATPEAILRAVRSMRP